MATVKKRSLIWNYFVISQEDEKTAICNECKESVSRGGSSVKNFNTTNLRNHLRRFHHQLFDELLVKEREDTEKKAEEGKQRKPSEGRQLTLVELQEQKEAWNYDHPEHTKVTKRIAEMIAIDSQPFSIVEDAGFVRLMKHTCPRYIILVSHSQTAFFSNILGRYILEKKRSGYARLTSFHPGSISQKKLYLRCMLI